ncbi:hypothetical protein [Oceaniglobus indicus]|uniref:hypothetical protein n=1 Tax=Oceaniglobus indicus TaxID=2047749 RepID=UPI0011AB4B9D|nr:hypothetical protein [Oceaniglobus indicus]
MEMPFTSVDEITALAAACFPLARIAATGIEEDVLELIPWEPAQDAKALAARLHRGEVFDNGVLAMLHDLIGVLDAEITEGTCVQTFFDHSPENVSNDMNWQQGRLTPDADRLSGALAVLLELYAALAAVYDILQAEKALTGLRTAA